MKVALAQLNLTVGDFQGNTEKILTAYRTAARQGAELVIVSELAVCGYPPLDLLLRPAFLRANQESLKRLCQEVGETGLLVGFVDTDEDQTRYNAAALLHRGEIVAVRHKTLLPTYDVFDEDRYFEPAATNEPVPFRGLRLGVTICEDMWSEPGFTPRRYLRNPVEELVQRGVDLLINISASPWYLGKDRLRRELFGRYVRRFSKPVLFCNQVGGNDELIFDGRSLVWLPDRGIVAFGKAFEEELLVVDLEQASPACEPMETEPEEDLFRALALGTRDFLHKCGVKSAVLGLSGGIDSALTACIAVEALGRENVLTVSLPSAYSSRASIEDAKALAANLGVRHIVIPIQRAFEVMKEELRPIFQDLPEDVTEENLQARIRGVYLMALSNKFGHMLLATGNKSEMATGYCTLYGDMCGGLDVLGDVPKTMVYRVARWLNRKRELIPESILIKPPSAELRPGQTDQDTLPPYDLLDQMLEAYVVEQRSAEELIASGFDPELVRLTVRLIDRSEFKRRQAAPVLKVTSKAFGLGRRIPIAQRYREL